MSNPNATLDPAVQKALIEFIKQKLGLVGAMKLRSEIQSCTCQPCQTFRAIFAGAEIPPGPSPS